MNLTQEQLNEILTPENVSAWVRTLPPEHVFKQNAGQSCPLGQYLRGPHNQACHVERFYVTAVEREAPDATALELPLWARAFVHAFDHEQYLCLGVPSNAVPPQEVLQVLAPFMETPHES